MGSFYKVKDLAKTTVDIAVSTGDNYITVADASVFPTSFPFVVSLFDSSLPHNDAEVEKVVCSGIAGNVLTVDGVLYNHPAGTNIQLLIVEDIFNDATYGVYSNIDRVENLLPVQLNAKGDLISFSNTSERLPVGSLGQVIVGYPNSDIGLKWIDPHVSAGFISVPSIVDNGDGTINIPENVVSLADNDVWEGTFLEYTLSAVTNQTLLDNAVSYIVGDYNNGNPKYSIVTDVNVINSSNVVPYVTVYRRGNDIYVLNWGALGNGLSNQITNYMVKTQRFTYQDGLALGETGTRIVTIEAGNTWNLIRQVYHSTFNSSVDHFEKFYHDAGVWTSKVVTQYENANYDDGADLVPLLPNKWVINWVYRIVSEDPEAGIVVGGSYNTLLEASEAEHPTDLPDEIVSFGLLVGRIIVQEGQDVAGKIETAFNSIFNPVPVSDHTDLTNIGIYTHGELDTHVDSISNPHGVTVTQIGAEPLFSKNTAFNKNFGIDAGTVCQGNDSRLSDARIPITHGNEVHSSTYIGASDVTKENLDVNGDIQTVITDSDDVIPTSGAVVDYVSSIGGSDIVNIFLPADAAYFPETNPADIIEELGSTVYAGFSYLAFDDTTAESAVWRVPVPDYDGGNITITSYSKPATTPSGDVTLQYDILVVGLADSEVFNSAVTIDTGVNISHSLGTLNPNTDISIATATIDPANVVADDLLVIEIKRDVTDTLVGDGHLLGIMLEYTRS